MSYINVLCGPAASFLCSRMLRAKFGLGCPGRSLLKKYTSKTTRKTTVIWPVKQPVGKRDTFSPVIASYKLLYSSRVGIESQISL